MGDAENWPNDNDGQADRLPPFNAEAEEGVLGCVLLDPAEALPGLIERFRDETVFYDLRRQQIYKTMVELYDDNDPIDVISLSERLKVWGLLDGVGGLSYIATLQDRVPSAANVEYYAEIVAEKALLRSMIQVCTRGVAAIYDSEADVQGLIDQIEGEVLRVAESRLTQSSKNIKQLVTEAMEDMDTLINRKGSVTGVPTGYPDFDKLTNGLQPADMIVIAARPSVGKTSLAMNIAENVAVKNGTPVGIFSLEMRDRTLVQRMICSMGAVNVRDLQEGFSNQRILDRLAFSAGKIQKAPLFIDDSAGISILQLRAKARRMRQRFGIKLVVIDYLQLLSASNKNRKHESRQQEVSDISSGIKSLAKELNVPVLVLSQLNREPERGNATRRPRLSDLRESGAIEQDADVVGLLFKTNRDEDEEERVEDTTITCKLDVAKQRNGPTGEVDLVFMKSYTRFESAARISSEDVPASNNRPVQQELP